MITNNFVEVYHRGVVAEHYLEKKKFMIWYHLDKDHGYKTIGIVQVRGIKELLTKEELKVFIDKLWERYRQLPHPCGDVASYGCGVTPGRGN